MHGLSVQEHADIADVGFMGIFWRLELTRHLPPPTTEACSRTNPSAGEAEEATW
jgi:hypothetical protein